MSILKLFRILIILSTISLLALPIVKGQLPNIYFGRHYPHGNSVVVFMYGANGPWKQMTNLEYTCNKFDLADNPADHPTCTTVPDTSINYYLFRDSEGNLLTDIDNTKEKFINNQNFRYSNFI